VLGSINPLVERARGSTYAVTAAWFMWASAIGGVLVGASAAGIGRALLSPLPGLMRLAVVLLATLVGLVLDSKLFGVRLPSTRRQVNDRWLSRYRSWVYGAGFGAQLGAGIATVVYGSSTYVWILASGASASLSTGALAGLVYGFIRGSTILSVARVDSGPKLMAFGDRLDRAESRIARRLLWPELGLVLALAALLGAATL
jgi:hypothetical protein